MFERMLQIRFDDPAALASYSIALANHGQTEKAFKMFERLLQAQPENISTLNNYGIALANHGPFEKAFEMFKHSLRIDPNHIVTLNNYGAALANYGLFEEAFGMFERSLRIDPNSPITLNRYGTALANHGQIDPDNFLTLTNYAKALANHGETKKAIEKFERTLQIKPNDIVALNSYATALANNNQFDKAFEKFEHSLEIQPDEPVTLYVYATVLAAAGDYNKAIAKLEKIQRETLAQDYANLICLKLGQLYYLIKQSKPANEYFELAIKNSKQADVTKLRAANHFLAIKPYSQEAIEILKEIHQNSPSYAQARKMLSLNLAPKEYFEMFNQPTQNALKDTEMLNRAMYHKIQNEISILKEIVHEIIADTESQDEMLLDILKG